MRTLGMKRAAVATALVTAIGAGYLYRGRALAATPAQPNASADVQQPLPSARAVAGPNFSAIVERYGPAVVNVSTTGTVEAALTSAPPSPQLDPHDPFSFFFHQFGPQPRGPMIAHGLGSGFIVKEDGLILTNAHVVDGASKVRVKLTDGREFPAKVVGIDKPTDVAVLKIEAKGLPTVVLGDASRIKVGEWVLAIGSPFGFENSATAGIVSARSRSLPDGGYVPFLQTDVAVNPGNSGGPLFDTRGEVIGINSQIISRTGGYEGLSFAIPIDVATKVQQQLVAHGHVTRAHLGVTIQDVDAALGESFGLEHPRGALVSSVEDGSPAAAAGLRPGDVILSLDGNATSSSADLSRRVAELEPGTNAKLSILRDRHARDVEVRVIAAEGTRLASADGDASAHGRLGLSVRPLTPQERAQAGIDGGVVVEEVSGAAAAAGIQPGDIVLALNGTRVSNAEALRKVVSATGKHVAVLVERGEARIFVPVELG